MKNTIAVDFDGTLCRHCFPEIGPVLTVHENVARFIKEKRQEGSTIILYTCRENLPERDYLDEAVEWCKARGIEFDYVNENPENPFQPTGRKLFADMYIDDKAVNVREFNR